VAPGANRPVKAVRMEGGVGRDADLALLHSECARTGRPRLVLIEGVAGIGKTARHQ